MNLVLTAIKSVLTIELLVKRRTLTLIIFSSPSTSLSLLFSV